MHGVRRPPITQEPSRSIALNSSRRMCAGGRAVRTATEAEDKA